MSVKAAPADAIEISLPDVRPLTTAWERLRGLLGTDASASPVVLVGCSSIHTFLMRYSIDVAFVSAGGRVLASHENVAPNRVISARGARYVIERPHAQTAWFKAGTTVKVTLLARVAQSRPPSTTRR